MKTKLIFFVALVLMLSGCELLKDASKITISTNLTADVPMVVVTPPTKSANLVKGITAIDFTKTQDLTLASNADIEPYLAKISEINLNSLVVTVTGLTEGQSINSVSLDVEGVGNIFTQTNINMVSNSFTPTITPAKLDQVAAKLYTDKKITLTVSGNVSGPMTFTVKLDFDTSIIASVL